MTISIKMHCISCSDFLRRVRRIATIPQELEQQREVTTIEVVTKAYEVASSDFYEALPTETTIQSGGISDYIFDKVAEKAIISKIVEEITGVAV